MKYGVKLGMDRLQLTNSNLNNLGYKGRRFSLMRLIFFTTFFLFFISLIIGPTFNYLSKKKGGQRLSYISPLAILIMLAPLIELLFWPGIKISILVRLFGLAFLVSALIIRMTWHIQWLKLKAINKNLLITNGLYKWTRHPMWFGILLLLLGLYISGGVISGIIMLIAFWTPYMIKQINREEQELISKHGGSYVTYSRSTKKLIPMFF